MKSAWDFEQQNARVCFPARLWYCSRAFWARLSGGHLLGQSCLVEASAAPRDVAVVHIVRHAEVVKRTKQPVPDPFHEVAAIHEVFATEGQQIAPVGTFWCCGQSEQELRLEVVYQLPVASGRGMVKLVHYDVVEIQGIKPPKMVHAAEGLD